MIYSSMRTLLVVASCILIAKNLPAQDQLEVPQKWNYSPELLKPFWRGDFVEQESVLFLKSKPEEPARGKVLFPIEEVISVRSSAGDKIYQEGIDYQYDVGTRELIIPAGSEIVTTVASDLRRPANSQRHQLTHRDGNGEILFGGGLEYHQMQTSVTYKKADSTWPLIMPEYDASVLPITLQKLQDQQEVSIVLLGDSISTGCNASGWGGGAPCQPPYQDLLVQHLQHHYQAKVKLTNLSVGGKSTPWGLTMIEKVTEHKPDLVILAFGMNDSAGRSAEEYGQNTARMIKATRDVLPQTEFILIATMLGNRDWTRLNHEIFPLYRNELAALCEPGIALADMTSVWNQLLKWKKDADLTGNGVNHPNDFGHRIYAQVLASLLIK